ncbi:hypothetical protein SLA2020_428490 [Shorea laevis]
MQNTSQVGLIDSISDFGDNMMIADPSHRDGGSENVADSAQTTDPFTNEHPGKKAYEKKQRRKTSAIWNDFVIVEVDGVKKS